MPRFEYRQTSPLNRKESQILSWWYWDAYRVAQALCDARGPPFLTEGEHIESRTAAAVATSAMWDIVEAMADHARTRG